MPVTVYARWLLLIGLLIAFDQTTKWLAEQMLSPYTPVPVMPMLNFRLMYNPGAAFSFLSDAGGWQRWFFIALSSTVSLILLIWLKRLAAQERLLAAALSLIAAGAIGNLIDRIAHGHVIDFIDVYYQTWHWPAFNLADSCISVGAVLLILHSFRSEPKTVKP